MKEHVNFNLLDFIKAAEEAIAAVEYNLKHAKQYVGQLADVYRAVRDAEESEDGCLDPCQQCEHRYKT